MCIFWPGISKDIADMIEKCEVCQKYQDKQPRENITSPPIPSAPWHTIATDIFEFKGKSYLIISDRFSKFVIVHELIDHSTEQTIKAFQSIFSEHDIPKVLMILTSAYHHQSNPAERAIRTVKSIMRKCMETGNSWHLGLLEYLCTPISDHIPSPSKPLNRRYRGVQPFLQFHANASTASFLPQERIQNEQQNLNLNEFHYNKTSVTQRKKINEGSNVLVHITDQKPKCWEKDIVIKRNDKTYDVQLQTGKVINCNRVDVQPSKLPFIAKTPLPLPELKHTSANANVTKVTQHKALPPPPPIPIPPPTANVNQCNTMVTTTRSGRTVKPPVKMNL